MSFDENTMRRVASLARIDLEEEQFPSYMLHLKEVMSLIETLDEVDISGVSPLVSIVPETSAKLRDDVTQLANCSQEQILSHAFESQYNYFRVPRIIE